MLIAPTSVYLGERAARRLIADCACLGWLLDPPRPSAKERLEHAIGGALTGTLLSALSGDHRMRARELLA